MSKKSESKDSQKNQRIQVFARCRPLNNHERKQFSPSIVDIIPEKKEILLRDKNANREFFFDKVFAPDTSQIAVYKSVVAPLIKEVMAGYNCTVFAYGQTGTGKTYTMEGERSSSKTSWEDDPGAGIIPRSLHQLFEELNKEENVEFSVRVSFLELYNEELFDLLSSTELSRLRLFEDSTRKGSVVIQGLEEIVVNSKDEVYAILEKGTARRQTAATLLNATSSRSHTVFSVTVHIKENMVNGEELLKTGKLNLVDLAGSENVGRSGAVEKRAREAGNINQSLLTLGRVITSLIEKAPHVPYRESKLTRLLQDSLGGHTKTSIIATISPAQMNFDETVSTLDYATKAKSITIKPEANQKMTKRALIKEYTEEIERLRKDLAAARTNSGYYIDAESHNGMVMDIACKSDLIKKLEDEVGSLMEKNEEAENVIRCFKAELKDTKEVLKRTTVQRDEKDYLVCCHLKTEQKLSGEAHQLLQVADHSTQDVSKLQDKLDRKTCLEIMNEKQMEKFRDHNASEFAELDCKISNLGNSTTAQLEKTASELGEFCTSLDLIQRNLSEGLSDMHTFTKKIIVDSLLSHLKTETNRSMCWLENIAEEITSRILKTSDHHEFQEGTFNTRFEEMKSSSLSLFNSVVGMTEQLQEKISSHKEETLQRGEEWKKLLKSAKDSLIKHCQEFDQELQRMKEISQSIELKQIGFEKDLQEHNCNFYEKFSMEIEENENLIGAQKKLIEAQEKSLETLKMHQKNFEKSLETSIEKQSNSSNILQLNELHSTMMKKVELLDSLKLPLASLSDSLDNGHMKDSDVLHGFGCTIDTQKLSELQKVNEESQNRMKSAVEQFIDQDTLAQRRNSEFLSEEFKKHSAHIAERGIKNESIVNNIQEEITSRTVEIAAPVQKECEKVQEGLNSTLSDLAVTKQEFQTVTEELQKYVGKRSQAIQVFLSEGIVKYVPTGTTPQRQMFSYPRLLTATSPHDRILQRFRSRQITAVPTIATVAPIDLPLNSSFESDESKSSGGASPDTTEDTHNVSFTSEDWAGFETDCSTFSLPDKENVEHQKKSSRVPKRLPANSQKTPKGFLKPATPKPGHETGENTRSKKLHSNGSLEDLSMRARPKSKLPSSSSSEDLRFHGRPQKVKPLLPSNS